MSGLSADAIRRRFFYQCQDFKYIDRPYRYTFENFFLKCATIAPFFHGACCANDSSIASPLPSRPVDFSVCVNHWLRLNHQRQASTLSISAVCEGEPVAEASCTLMNDKGSWYVKTPGAVMIQQAYGDLAVDCKKEDSVASTTYQSQSNTGVWGNIIAGGIIGYAVDAGIAYPSTMTVTMNPPCAGKDTKITAQTKEKRGRQEFRR